MRTLEFSVDKQMLRKKAGCDFSNIVAGTVGYLQAKFHFSNDEWTDCKKVACFWINDNVYPVLLNDDDSCIIPSEVLKTNSFSVSVTGARSSEYRIETGKYKVKQEVR